jgi:hypothetical protein
MPLRNHQSSCRTPTNRRLNGPPNRNHVQFREEHKHLLTAQVLLTGKMAELAEAQKQLTDAQRHTDERLNALVTIVDGVIRKPPDLPI